jgi:hypothetical protein
VKNLYRRAASYRSLRGGDVELCDSCLVDVSRVGDDGCDLQDAVPQLRIAPWLSDPSGVRRGGQSRCEELDLQYIAESKGGVAQTKPELIERCDVIRIKMPVVDQLSFCEVVLPSCRRCHLLCSEIDDWAIVVACLHCDYVRESSGRVNVSLKNVDD